MLKQFENHVSEHLSFLRESRLLIAISGGLDSVVLMHLCQELKLNIALAHCNFNLRGEESDEDENFILQLAEDHDLEIFIENFDTEAFANDHKMSTQMAARVLRYTWFNELAGQLSFDFILTAHHADDNLETFLINLSRGTGLEGLKGIPEINDNIIRPLLPFSRETIELYAKQNHIKWHEDSSNTSNKYLRNALRNEVISSLKKINPTFLDNFKTTIDNLKQAYQIIDDRINEVAQDVLSKKDKAVYIDVDKLKQLNNPKAYLYEMLKGYGFTQWDDVYDLLHAQSGKQVFSSDWRLLKDRTHLILAAISKNSHEEIYINQSNKTVQTPFGDLLFEEVEEINEKGITAIYVDKSRLSFPMKIRKWQEGDYFHPYGMKGRKKVSKYFKDEKLSLLEKENTWLLSSGQDIIWIIGRRADERFKVTDKTTDILKISLLNANS